MTTIGGIDPGFTGQPSGEPPYAVMPDPARVFADRARRFAATAPGSEIEGYLRFLATLAEAQAAVAAVTTRPTLPDIALALANGMPPLSPDVTADPGGEACLAALLDRLRATTLDDGPTQVVARLDAMSPEARRDMIRAVAEGLYEIERLGECGIVAAALQVWYAHHAAQIDASRLRNIGETICPCCGGAPASSLVVAWQNANGNRYLTCSLCCTLWNHVRVKCTACGATKGISYRSIEGSTGEIAAEVCETCRGYAKHLSQTKNAQLDPVADDIASYGLDIMLREDGWHRAGLNPFLILT